MTAFNYDLLEALGTVVQARGFQRASKILHLTQSAISQRIKLLEDQIGVPLLSRTSPPAATVTGGHLLRHYKQVTEMEHELRELLFGEKSESSTRLLIGVNADSLATWFLDVLESILGTKKLLYELLVENEEHSYQLLQRGEVLGCVSSSARPVLGCDCEPLGIMRYRCTSTRAFKRRYFSRGLDAESLTRAPSVLFNRKDDVHARFMARHFGIRQFEGTVHFIPTSEGFLEAIRRGMAYGIVPELQAREDFKKGRLCDLAPGKALDIKLYWHYMRRETSTQKLLRRTIIESAAKILN